MTPAAHRALAYFRRLLICAGIGFACGAIPGALIVLIGWFPGAMATYAENPHFVDPRSTVLGWICVWAVVLGTVGALIGFAVGAIPTGRDSSELPGADSAATLGSTSS